MRVKKIGKCALVMVIILLCNAALGFGFWVWTPKTEKFENARNSGKDTPQSQADFASKQKDLVIQLKEWKTLLARFPHSKEAAKAIYNIGLIYEKMGKYYQAHKMYEKLIKEYPFSDFVVKAIKREYELGRKFFENYSRKFWDLSKPVVNPAPEIFELIVSSSPYSEYAVPSLYYEGLFYKKQKNYQQAQSCFERILKNYPDSPWADKAEYQIAMCYYEMSLKPEYDQEFAQKAKEALKKFLLKYPDSSFYKNAQQLLSRLDEKQANHILEIARFYLKQGKTKSALIYLKQIIRDYPSTDAAKQAHNILDNLKAKQ